jgi:uncharacterized protein YjbI with pentapeptide repeats
MPATPLDNGDPAIRPPQLPKQFALSDLPEGQIVHHGRYQSLALSRLSVVGQVADAPCFEQVRWLHIDASASQLRGIQFDDVRFEHCNLANAEWPRAALRRCELLDSRLTGFTASYSYLQEVLVKDCTAHLLKLRSVHCKAARFERCALIEADFQHAKLPHIVFSQCDLTGADFRHADLAGARFSRCELRGADLSGAKLAGADLRGCTLDGTRVGLAELRGATIDPPQALALVRALGLTVEWSEEDVRTGRSLQAF